MRRLLTLLAITVLCWGCLIQSAEAKRFGGGKSFGATRSTHSSFSRSNYQPSSVNNQRSSMAGKIAGPLLGLLAGTALASLFMGHGFGSGVLSWIILGFIVLLAISVLKRMFNTNQSSAAFHPNSSGAPLQSKYSPAASLNQLNVEEPQTIDREQLAREAKALFIRLQAAYDQKNLVDIRQFTSPAVFAEIQLQLDERGSASNITEVVNLNADIIEANQWGASVVFSGLIKEDPAAMPQQFRETWFLDYDNHQGKWLVAGIQQN